MQCAQRETYRALSEAAQDLVRVRGLDHVTVEDIAAAANVSVRTFFNYFPSKEEAVVGIDEDVLAELADEVRRHAPAAAPIDVLRTVLLAGKSPTDALARWRLRNELVRTYPALLPRHLAAMVRAEEALAQAFADRRGIDLATDPAPRLFVAAAVAALRAALAWWDESGGAMALDALLDAAFRSVSPDFSRTR